jgi:hypothetical protein
MRLTKDEIARANAGLEAERQEWLERVGNKCEHEFVLGDHTYSSVGTERRQTLVCVKCGGYKDLWGYRL